MNWWALLFEMLGLSLLGFLYYQFQKRRILKNFQDDIDFVTEEILILTHAELEIHPHSTHLKMLAQRMDQLKIDRQSFLTEDEHHNLLQSSDMSAELKKSLVDYRSTLLNRYEKK